MGLRYALSGSFLRERGSISPEVPEPLHWKHCLDKRRSRIVVFTLPESRQRE